MGMCWAPDCRHYSAREKCRFFSFPKTEKVYKRWIKLIRRKDKPGPGARICSCHFKDGQKENGPEIFSFNEAKLFQENHLAPEKVKRRKRNIADNVKEDPTYIFSTKRILETERYFLTQTLEDKDPLSLE